MGAHLLRVLPGIRASSRARSFGAVLSNHRCALSNVGEPAGPVASCAARVFGVKSFMRSAECVELGAHAGVWPAGGT